MRKTFTLFLAIATLMALAVPASAGRGGKPGKAPKVSVSMASSLYSAHEVGDLIRYTIDVTNNTNEDVTVFFDETSESYVIDTVAAGESTTFLHPYYVEFVPELGNETTLVNSALAKDPSGRIVGSDTVETAVYGYEPCGLDGNGTFAAPDGYSVCIWKPSVHVVWTFEVTPPDPGKKPTSVLLNLRDHVPGNWCPFTPDGEWRWRGDPATLEFDVNIPDWNAVPQGYIVCPDGGAGGDPFAVGTPDSFYFATYGPYDVTAIAP